MNKKKKWIYIFIAALSIIMIGMAVTSFFCSKPPFLITTNIIIIFVIIAILLVFDSIESLSIGDVFTLKKKVKEKEVEISKLNEENAQLRNQFISVMTTTFNNKMSNQIYFGDYDKGLEVKSAAEEEVEKEKENESAAINDETIKSEQSTRNTRFSRVKFLRGFEQFLIEKFACENDIDINHMRKDIKITGALAKADPLIDKEMVYDAYLRRPIDEIFIETALITSYHMLMDYKIYFMISRVYHYSKANQVKAKLVLVVPKYSKEYIESKPQWLRSENPSELIIRLKELYSPAIENGWLEIVEIDVSQKEMQALEKSAIVEN